MAKRDKFHVNELQAQNDINQINEETNDVLLTNKDTIYRTSDYSLFASYPKSDLRLELHSGTAREQLRNSIAAHGITSPIKVIESKIIFNDIAEKFTVLSGHNRLDIAKELNIPVPYIILSNLSEDVCDEIVAEEHILNRQQADLKPSQMMHLLLAIKKTSKSQQELLEKSKLGRSNTYNYLHLEKMLPELLCEYVDTRIIQFRMAEKISQVSQQNQKRLYDYLKSNRITKIAEKTLSNLMVDSLSEWTEEVLDNAFKSEGESKVILKVNVTDIINVIPESDRLSLESIIVQMLKEKYGI